MRFVGSMKGHDCMRVCPKCCALVHLRSAALSRVDTRASDKRADLHRFRVLKCPVMPKSALSLQGTNQGNHLEHDLDARV